MLTDFSIRPWLIAFAALGIAVGFALRFWGLESWVAGGAAPLKPTLRMAFWGAFAMALTAGIGAVFGMVV